MNVDEAIANLYELSAAAYQLAKPNLGNDLGRIADVLRAHVERKVDDAMVERALKSWMGDSIIIPFAGKQRMREALIAALVVEGA